MHCVWEFRIVWAPQTSACLLELDLGTCSLIFFQGLSATNACPILH
jgi:hypothetical protein